MLENCCRRMETAGSIYLRFKHTGPDSRHARPTPSVSSASPSKCRMAQTIDWYSLTLPRDCLSESGHCGSRPSQPVCRSPWSHVVESPSLAKPANRWNLPIAGVAVQINRVQYFSLSALVREGKPIFVICTVHDVRLISDWEGEICMLRKLRFLHAHKAHWKYKLCATELENTGLVVLVGRLVSSSCYSSVIRSACYIYSVS